EGWLDFVCPMDYTVDHEEFRNDVRQQVANTAGHIPLAAGIGSYLQKTPDDVLKQIEIARSESADGYVLFDYKREGMDALLDALAKGPQATPTYPAYHTPDCEWRLQSGVKRKDEAEAYTTGDRVALRFDLRLPQDWPTAGISAEVYLEELSGMRPQPLRVSKVKVGDRAHYVDELSFQVPDGRSRLGLRALLGTADFRTRLVVVRGPIIEGLPPEKIAELRARDLPPNPVGPGRRVAIYNDGMAASGLLKSLQGVPDVNAYPLYHLKPEHWKTAEVLILPQLNDVADITPEVVAALREWVQKGGRLILTHDAVGYRWHPRMFPEVGRGSGASKQKQVEVLPNDWGLTPGIFEHAFSTHLVLQPAPGAVVLAREAATPADANATPGVPAMIAGGVGQGTVIMYGSLLGYMPTGVMPEGERRLLLELVSKK
ncbi:MAG: hypothetical protein M3347_03530, partial [Armatimonadota bacterium]|nr:hypothetical protein [Armatimonadota bacterium]